MSRITTENRRQKSRLYSQTNRDSWAELGFRPMSIIVHDDDRALTLCDADVARCDKLVALVDQENPDVNVLAKIARKNMTTLPLEGELLEFEAKLKDAGTVPHSIKQCLEAVRHYKKRYNGAEATYEKRSKEDSFFAGRNLLTAQAVAFSAAAAAHFRKAKALAVLADEDGEEE
jgi:hypothetical protein